MNSNITINTMNAMMVMIMTVHTGNQDGNKGPRYFQVVILANLAVPAVH